LTQSKLKRSNAVLIIILLFTHYDWGRHKYTIDVLNKIEKTEKNRKRKRKPPSNAKSFGTSSDYYLP